MAGPDRHPEKSDDEIAQVESLLRSFSPRSVRLESVASPRRDSSYKMAMGHRPWTLVATWSSGVVVGVLFMLFLRIDSVADPAVVTAPVGGATSSEAFHVKKQPEALPRQARVAAEGPPLRIRPSAPIANSFGIALPEGSLTAGTHLVSTFASGAIDRDGVESSEDYPEESVDIERRQPTTRRDLMRELQEAPGLVL